jgi:hypothetical protein
VNSKYALEIQNCGSDTYIVMSKGHHDPHEFMKQVRIDGYDWNLGNPEHLWIKATPCKTGEFHMNYNRVKKGVRGAFPATYSFEAYGSEIYQNPELLEAA